MFRPIVKIAIVALGVMSAAPLAATAQQPDQRPARPGRAWAQEGPRAERAERGGGRGHRRRRFMRRHPGLARQHRLALRRLAFRRDQRPGMTPRLREQREPRGR